MVKTLSDEPRSMRVAIRAAFLAAFVVWMQPLFLSEPHRAVMEILYYIPLILSYYTASQGTGNFLDRFVVSWMDYNNNHIPPATGYFAREDIVIMDAAEYTPEAFHKASKNGKMPVVVRGLFAESEAVKTWTPEYLKNVTSTVPVKAQHGGDKCRMSQHNAVVGRYAVPQEGCFEMTEFGDFLSRMKDEGLYAKQVTGIFKVYPKLFDDLELHRLHEEVYPLNSFKHKNALATSLVGHGNKYPLQTPYHAAVASNYFIQVQGHKEWNLLPPKWTPYFQTYFHYGVPAVQSRISCYDGPETFEKFNYDQFPVTKAVLNPGDFLYVPPWWFHMILHPNDEYHMAASLRPLDSAFTEHIPGLSSAFANTVGILPTSLLTIKTLFICQGGWDEMYGKFGKGKKGE